MNRRALLVWLVNGLGLLGLVAVAYPFIASFRPSARALNDSLVVVELPTLEPGVVHSVDVDGTKMFVLKPTTEQAAAIKQLDPYVFDSSINNFRENIGAYVYWAYSPKWRCPLEHQPPQASRLREWAESAKWLGGYWDSRCEISYDYAGRAINSYEHAFNGYTWPGSGLESPKVFEKSGAKYVVSKYHR